MHPTAAAYRKLLTVDYPPTTDKEKVYASLMITMADNIEKLEVIGRNVVTIVGALTQKNKNLEELLAAVPATTTTTTEAPVPGTTTTTAAAPKAPTPASAAGDAEEFEDMEPIKARVVATQNVVNVPMPGKVTPSVSKNGNTSVQS